MSYTNKPFEELDVIDDFLMNTLATDPEVGVYEIIAWGKYDALEEAAEQLFRNGATIELVSASIAQLPKEKVQEIYDKVMSEKPSDVTDKASTKND